MAYLRWSTSKWYVYWNASNVKSKEAELLCLDCEYYYSYARLSNPKEYLKIKDEIIKKYDANESDMYELEIAIQKFIRDVDNEYTPKEFKFIIPDKKYDAIFIDNRYRLVGVIDDEIPEEYNKTLRGLLPDNYKHVILNNLYGFEYVDEYGEILNLYNDDQSPVKDMDSLIKAYSLSGCKHPNPIVLMRNILK